MIGGTSGWSLLYAFSSYLSISPWTSPVGGNHRTLALNPLILSTVAGGGTDVGTRHFREEIMKMKKDCQNSISVYR